MPDDDPWGPYVLGLPLIWKITLVFLGIVLFSFGVLLYSYLT